MRKNSLKNSLGRASIRSLLFLSSMKKITIYGKSYCGYCDAAKRMCETLGAEYDYIDVFASPETETQHKTLVEKYQHYTVPLILADGEFVGGFTELQAAHKAGKLG